MLSSETTRPARPGGLPTLRVLGILAVTVALYVALIPWRSLDASHWFVPWLDQIVVQGPVRSLAQPMQVGTDGAAGFANYNPPYLYLLVLGSVLSPFLGELTIVKLVATGGALFCAGCLHVLIRPLVSRQRAALAAAGLLLLPTVALNAAAWGQTDTIYAGLLALVVAAAMAQAWSPMMLAFGAALAFKLPAAFIGPFLLYVCWAYRVPVWHLLLAPLAYALSLVPACLAGRPVSELATVYLDQAGTYRWLSMNAPNPWAFIQHLGLMPYEQGVPIGLAAAGLAGLAIASLARSGRLAGGQLLLLAAASVTLMPFLLPKMHDRYFFPADLLTYALAVVQPRRRTVLLAAAVQLGSLGAYSSILFGFHLGTFLGTLSIGFALVVIALELASAFRSLPRGAAHRQRLTLGRQRCTAGKPHRCWLRRP